MLERLQPPVCACCCNWSKNLRGKKQDRFAPQSCRTAGSLETHRWIKQHPSAVMEVARGFSAGSFVSLFLLLLPTHLYQTARLTMLEMQLNHFIAVSAPVMQAHRLGCLGYIRFCGTLVYNAYSPTHFFFFFNKGWNHICFGHKGVSGRAHWYHVQ